MPTRHVHSHLITLFAKNTFTKKIKKNRNYPRLRHLIPNKKEKEDLAKELEKVENKAKAIEIRRKVQFINSNFALASWPNLSTQATISAPSCGSVVSNQNISQSTPTF